MKPSGFTKATLVFAMISVCAFSFIGCAEEAQSEVIVINKVEGLTGGVAATVNGVEIEEDTITNWIESYRRESQLTSDKSWAEWIIDSGETVDSIREKIINMYITKELIKEAATEYGIKVSSSDIDAYITETRAYFDSDYAWEATLAAKGYTEQEYRDSVEYAFLETAVKDGIVEATEPTDEELLAYAQDHAASYNGAKKSSNVLFASDDDALAREVLKKINSGEMEFEEAVDEYSIDSETASSGGNVGWDALNSSLVSTYTTALDELELGQISELVVSEYGIYIIKCTNIFIAPETITSLEEIPEDFINLFRNKVKSINKSEAYDVWYQSYYDNADIVINDMPKNLPYYVDLEKYKEQEPVDEKSNATDPSDEPITTTDPLNEGGASDTSNGSGDEVTSGTTEGETGAAAAESGQAEENVVTDQSSK